MTPRQIELIKSSWAAARPVAETVVRLFYRRLFETAPQLRGRYCTSMSAQGDQVLASIETLLNRLEKAPLFGHQDDEETRLMADAWCWALEAEMGHWRQFEVDEAWREALGSEAAAEVRSIALGGVVAA